MQMSERDIKTKISEVVKGLFQFDLPIGVYLVTKDGDFVKCNPRAREILHLPQTGEDINTNINDFYCDTSERSRVIKELEECEANGKFLEKKIIHFRVKEQEIWVQAQCRSVKDPETGESIGYIGCLVDVTEEESLHQLFDKLPVGVYKLDAQNRIVWVNKALLDILGYELPSELEGKKIKYLYAEPKEADRFNELILNKGSVVNERVELLKKTKERCYISVSAYTKTEADSKKYIGREGTIQDVTVEENYRQIRETVPVGTYMVRQNDQGIDVISQCNKAFADMFEYDMKEIIGLEVKKLYATEKDYEDFIKEITDKYKNKEKPEGIPIKTKTSKGRLMTLEVHYRVLADGAGNITGRAGVVLDISNEVALRELRDDIGKILHFYSSALVTLEQSIKPVLRAIGPDPFKTGELLTGDRSIDALSEPAKNLKNALVKLLEIKNTSPERQNAISSEDWVALENLRHVLEDYRELSPYPEFQVAALHEIPGIILDIYNKMEKRIFPREWARDFFNKVKEFERICCLIRTHQALDVIMEVDFPIRALREYVIFQQRPTESPTVCKISSLIQTTVFQLYPFASQRKVDIEQEYHACQVHVKADERSVLRALYNLIYNAIKYSWYRKIGKKPWINVKAFTVKNEVHVEIQNYGVPIAKEEIENELIFKFGYRGKYSGDRRRMGTGIGLTDARETARKHGGDVKIKSVPASGEDGYDYSKAFLTTATFILPIYG